MTSRLLTIWTVLAIHLCNAQQTTPTASPEVTRHGVTLLPVADTGTHIVEVDGRAFATVDGLKRYIAGLRSGDHVNWVWFLDRSPDNPFNQARQEIWLLCEQKGSKFHVLIE